MAILFDWYENPKPSDKEQGEKTLHPRLKYNGSIRYRLFSPLPDQYGTRNDRHQTKGYQSKIESDPVSCRSDIEK